MKCWAKSVSECCSTQSREHYVTKGLFSGKMIYVENAPFLSGSSREISKASLTKKCLCKKHNELLSEFDSEAILLGKTLKEILACYLERRNNGKSSIEPLTKAISIEKFSRWFIKTYLGFYDFFKCDSNLQEDVLAAMVFSEGEIASHIEYSLEMKIGDDFQIKECVSIAPIERNELTFGMQIELYGICIRGVFHEQPQMKQNPIDITFYDYPEIFVGSLIVE